MSCNVATPLTTAARQSPGPGQSSTPTDAQRVGKFPKQLPWLMHIYGAGGGAFDRRARNRGPREVASGGQMTRDLSICIKRTELTAVVVD